MHIYDDQTKLGGIQSGAMSELVLHIMHQVLCGG